MEEVNIYVHWKSLKKCQEQKSFFNDPLLTEIKYFYVFMYIYNMYNIYIYNINTYIYI